VVPRLLTSRSVPVEIMALLSSGSVMTDDRQVAGAATRSDRTSTCRHTLAATARASPSSTPSATTASSDRSSSPTDHPHRPSYDKLSGPSSVPLRTMPAAHTSRLPKYLPQLSRLREQRRPSVQGPVAAPSVKGVVSQLPQQFLPLTLTCNRFTLALRLGMLASRVRWRWCSWAKAKVRANSWRVR
jgi:hypothetical protein